MNLLETKNLNTFFPVKAGFIHKVTAYVKAVNDVTLYVKEGEIVSIVGESGCGKSTLGLSVLGLVPVTSGEILLANNQINPKKPGSWKPYRKDFQIIFQDPFSSLNPRHTIYRILSEPLLVHKIFSKKTVRDGVAALMEQVGLTGDYMERFPQFDRTFNHALFIGPADKAECGLKEVMADTLPKALRQFTAA